MHRQHPYHQTHHHVAHPRHHQVHHRRHRYHLPDHWLRWLFFGAVFILAIDALVIYGRFKPETDPFAPETLVVPPAEAPTTVIKPVDTPLPNELNLAIPFTPQAPTANWDPEHEEFCEEASVLMVERFFAGKTIEGHEDAEAGLQELAQWERDNNYPLLDSTAAEVAEMLRIRNGLTVDIVTNPTVDDLKRALTENRLVVVPAAGRLLKNKNFTPPGPLYHMFVLRGYTARGDFIVNDPGIRQGNGWKYTQDILMTAMGDFNAGHPETGAKVVLVVSN